MAALPRWLPHRLIGPDQEKVGMAVLHKWLPTTTGVLPTRIRSQRPQSRS